MEDKVKQLRKYIRGILKESMDLDIKIQPPPEESLGELQQVISQYQNRYNPEELQPALDTHFEDIFDTIIQAAGHESRKGHIKELKKTHIPTISSLKKVFMRPRPDNVAEMLGVNWSGDGIRMDTDDTFSYPSGHACQAYYVALRLIDEYPELRAQLLEAANMVAQSRIDRGVHFPSDIKAGKDLAYQLHGAGL